MFLPVPREMAAQHGTELRRLPTAETADRSSGRT